MFSNNSDQQQSPESIEQQLRTAVKQGDLNQLKDLIYLQGDDTANNLIQQHRLLHIACAHGHVQIVNYFLDNKFVDIEAANSMGETALMVTCNGGSISTASSSSSSNSEREEAMFQIAKLLIERGKAKIEFVTKSGNVSTLHAACSSGSKKLVEFLIEQYKKKFCHHAEEENSPLLRNFVNAKTNMGKFPLAIAAENNFLDIVKYLVSEVKLCDIELQSDQDQFIRGGTALHFGSSFLPIVKFLVAVAGANVNAQNSKDRSTPLHYACYDRKLDCVQYLLAVGADTNMTNSLDETPLFKAIEANDASLAQYLLEKGGGGGGEKTRVDIPNIFGMTPLHKAAWNNSLTCVQMIMSHRKNVVMVSGDGKDEDDKNTYLLNMQDNDLNTALHIACMNGSADVVDYLVQGFLSGASSSSSRKNNKQERKKDFSVDTTIRNRDGKTAKEVAQEKANDQIVQYFEENVPEGTCCGDCVIC